MKVNSKSLIAKMIKNSFWFIEKNIVPKPTTSCGLFLAGVASGLWHVAYTLFSGCFLTGGVFAITLITGTGDLLHIIGNLPLTMKIFIVAGMMTTIVGVCLALPLVAVVTVLKWLGQKGTFSKVAPVLKKVFNMLTENQLTRKLSALCKPIDYKDN